MSPEQKADLEDVFGADWKGLGNLDYVAGWYKKCAEMIFRGAGGPPAKLQIRCALVSTNSIMQGEQVASVWRPLVERFGVSIDFAHRTFRRDSAPQSRLSIAREENGSLEVRSAREHVEELR